MCVSFFVSVILWNVYCMTCLRMGRTFSSLVLYLSYTYLCYYPQMPPRRDPSPNNNDAVQQLLAAQTRMMQMMTQFFQNQQQNQNNNNNPPPPPPPVDRLTRFLSLRPNKF